MGKLCQLYALATLFHSAQMSASRPVGLLFVALLCVVQCFDLESLYNIIVTGLGNCPNCKEKQACIKACLEDGSAAPDCLDKCLAQSPGLLGSVKALVTAFLS